MPGACSPPDTLASPPLHTFESRLQACLVHKDDLGSTTRPMHDSIPDLW